MKDNVRKRIYICMVGSLCCIAEIDRMLKINYNAKDKNYKKIFNLKKKKIRGKNPRENG